MDGLEAVRRMRERGTDTPVLFLTARDAIEDRVGGLNAGADDYLVKPFALEELSARLRVLPRSQFGAGDSRLVAGDLTLVDDSSMGEILGVKFSTGDAPDIFLQNAPQVVEQYDAPENVYHSPSTEFVAKFVGKSNWLSESEMFRPEAASLSPQKDALHYELPVQSVQYLGSSYEITLP